MTTETLNTTNCKEYNDNDFDALMNETNDINWDIAFNRTEEEKAEDKKQADAERKAELLIDYNNTYNKAVKNLPTTPCPKCSGTGQIHAYNHVSGGVCFKCEGYGKI